MTIVFTFFSILYPALASLPWFCTIGYAVLFKNKVAISPVSAQQLLLAKSLADN